jgi:hypothetical protein
MKTKLGITALLLAAISATAQVPGAAQTKFPKVTAVPVETVNVKPGGSAPVQMSFRVIHGYHINSNKPKSELLIPTAITFDVPTDITLAKVTYPPGKDYTFDFSPDEKLSVYTGDFTVGATVLTSKSMSKGTFRVHGTLRYQACDNRACYPPGTIPIQFDVKVATAKSSKPARKNPAQSPHIHQ